MPRFLRSEHLAAAGALDGLLFGSPWFQSGVAQRAKLLGSTSAIENPVEMGGIRGKSTVNERCSMMFCHV